MPDFSSIPLSIATPPPLDPMTAYQPQLMRQQIQQNQTQQSIQNQKLQQDQMKTQEMQADQAEQEALRPLFIKHAHDPYLDSVIQDAADSGTFRPNTLIGLHNTNNNMKLNYSRLTEAQIAAQKMQSEQAYNIFQPVIDAKDEDRPALYTQQRDAAIKAGLIKPDSIDEQYPGATQFGLKMAILGTHSASLKDAEAKAKIQADQALLAERQASESKNLLDSLGGAVNISPNRNMTIPAEDQGPMYMDPNVTNVVPNKPGNINLRSLKPINNGDGTWSTVNPTSFLDTKSGSPTEGKEVMVRGILNGKKVEPEDPRAGGPTPIIDALKSQYYKDNQYLGIFEKGDADKYGKQLHENWENRKIPGTQVTKTDEELYKEWRDQLPTAARRVTPSKAPDNPEAFIKNFHVSAGTASAIAQREENEAAKAQGVEEKVIRDTATGLYDSQTLSEYTRKYDDLLRTNPERAKKFPDPDKLTSLDDNTKKRILHAGMTPEQITQENEKDKVKSVGMNESQYRAWYDKHDALQKQEQDQHKLADEYGSALQVQTNPDGTGKDGNPVKVVDPRNGREVLLDGAMRDYFQKQAVAAQAKAKELSQSAKQIRQRLGGGEFAPGGDGQAGATQAPQAWSVGGKTWTRGQRVTTKSGETKYVVEVKDGKVLTSDTPLK